MFTDEICHSYWPSCKASLRSEVFPWDWASSLRISMSPTYNTSRRYESKIKGPAYEFSQANTSQLVFSMQLLFIIAVLSCKVAASLLIYRLTCHKTHRMYALVIVTVSVVCCFVSLMLVSVGFGSRVPWIHQKDEAETVVSLLSSDPGQKANANTACNRPADGSSTPLSPTSSMDV